MYFEYGEREIRYLKSRDPVLGTVIDSSGHIYRETCDDLFSCIIRQIAGQQISDAALASVWERIVSGIGRITPESIYARPPAELRKFGISLRKAEYITGLAKKILDRSLDLDRIAGLSDAEVIQTLSSIRGIGVWTAEMTLIFGMRRPDVISFGDFGIRRGMQKIYHHEKIDRQIFKMHAETYSPYATTASLYLWQAAKSIPERQETGYKSTDTDFLG